MSHAPTKAFLPKALAKRMEKLNIVEQNGLKLVRGFGIFMDTHRDQPHVGTFNDDIHRGNVLPTLVDYLIDDDALRNPEDGRILLRHEKHLFIEPEVWGQFLIDFMMTNGVDPRSGDGSLPTSHFRDARAKVYLLRSFRQMVEYNLKKGKP